MNTDETKQMFVLTKRDDIMGAWSRRAQYEPPNKGPNFNELNSVTAINAVYRIQMQFSEYSRRAFCWRIRMGKTWGRPMVSERGDSNGAAARLVDEIFQDRSICDEGRVWSTAEKVLDYRCLVNCKPRVISIVGIIGIQNICESFPSCRFWTSPSLDNPRSLEFP